MARWLVALAAAAAVLPSPATAAVVRRDGAIESFFVDELVANLTSLEEEHQQASEKRGLFQCKADGDRTVNLGYAKYQGYLDSDSGLNVWKGVRFAAPPVGSLRWQPPQFPDFDMSAPVEPATEFGPMCPQNIPAVPNAPFIPGDEDCLFLNVWAPENAKNLPVMVWIHGGGYGLGDGRQDFTDFVKDNEDRFVVVSIQYRLSAFGFLSSQEVHGEGTVNAGLLDQALSLAWVKAFICQFGGNPLDVTITGESAGAGSVMYHGMAVGGNLGNLLFNKGISASTYLPFHYRYDDDWPTERYYRFAELAGCGSSGAVFDCLVSADTMTLQQASYQTVQEQNYGYWAFYPVTDGIYIQKRPVEQMASKRMNGQYMLVGNNANEGPLFVPHNIETVDDLKDWLRLELENLSEAELDAVLAANPSSSGPSDPRFETDGVSAPYALDVSQDATGQQQRGNNIYAEQVFVCPSYWLTDAYDRGDKKSWHYQYSVPFAYHGADVNSYFGPALANQPDDFNMIFRRIWGNFIVSEDPNASGVPTWPVWDEGSPRMLDLNTTGGVPYETANPAGVVVTEFSDPGVTHDFEIVAADSWEGGRGARCDFYEGMAPEIPA